MGYKQRGKATSASTSPRDLISVDALGHLERKLKWRSGQWREFWGMPTYIGHCGGRTHWRERRGVWKRRQSSRGLWDHLL